MGCWKILEIVSKTIHVRTIKETVVCLSSAECIFTFLNPLVAVQVLVYPDSDYLSLLLFVS